MQHNEPTAGTVTGAAAPPSSDSADESHRYLMFSLGAELYACSLTQVREVIKVASIKPVPYMVPHFKGVINLRGKIIGVVDLSQKLNLKGPQGQRLILVTETTQGLLGVIVDDVASVEEILPEQIAKDAAAESKIAPQFFEGIGKLKDRLVHIVRLADIVADEDYRVA